MSIEIPNALRTAAIPFTLALALAVPFSTAHAAGTVLEVRECVRNIAALERSSARRTKGDERRQIITELGQIKITCMDGDVKAAYRAAEKHRTAPQQAKARD